MKSIFVHDVIRDHIFEESNIMKNKNFIIQISIFAIILLSAILLFCPSPKCEQISIASFNIQVFGQTKMSKPSVVDILVKTVKNFDIVAIQEIRDSSRTTMKRFKKHINSVGGDYEFIVGPRLGRTSSKEQYAIGYKTSIIIPEGHHYTYIEPVGQDKLHREPLIAEFTTIDGFSFVLIVIHVDPDEVLTELSTFPNIIADAIKHFNNPNIMILGDMNADCTYFNENSKLLPIQSDPYIWIIPNEFDTTIAKGDCTYDRMIISPSMFKHFTGNADIFRFDKIYSVSNPKLVSDHYPIYAIFN